MSELQKLETLLSRVQQRKTQQRGARADALPLMAASAAAAPMPPPTRSQPAERAAVTEERVSLPGARPAVPAAPKHEPAPAASQGPRRPGGGRLSTPLEMALEDELSRPPVAAAMSKAAAPPKPTEPSMPQPRVERSEEPFSIEPEPLREAARPIAQVMSKHAPEMDATFGAMLKRSLSLRPR